MYSRTPLGWMRSPSRNGSSTRNAILINAERASTSVLSARRMCTLSRADDGLAAFILIPFSSYCFLVESHSFGFAGIAAAGELGDQNCGSPAANSLETCDISEL